MANRSGGGRAGSRTVWVLALIFLLGIALRGLYLVEVTRSPDFELPLVDAAFHHYWARSLATGDWQPPPGEPDPHVQSTPYFRPPGYAYALALAFKLTGPGYLWPRVLQMAVGLFSAYLAYRIGRRWLGSAAGLWAALFMATHWVLILLEADFQEPVLSVLLILVLVQVLLTWSERMGLRLAVAAGGLVGLLALMRPNALSLLPAVAIWMIWFQRPGFRGSRWRAPAALLAGAVLVVSPVTARNCIVAKDFVLISSNGGLNLLIANRDGADGTIKATLPGVGKLDTCFDHPAISAGLQQRLGRRLRDSQVSNYFAQEALRWIGRHPGEAIKLIGRRTLLFWGPREVDDNRPIHPEREHSPLLRRIPTSFAGFLALALAGCALFAWESRRGGSPRERRPDAPTLPLAPPRSAIPLLVLLTLSWFVAYLPFSILSRYRTPIVPLLILLGSWFLQRCGQLVLTRARRRLLVWSLIWLALAGIAHVNCAGYRPSRARWHYQRGLVQMQLHNPDLAVAELRAALEQNPRYVSAANDLGALLAQQGRLDESIRVLQTAVALEPENPSAHYNLAAALELRGDLAESRSHYLIVLRFDPTDRQAQGALRRVQAAMAESRAPGSPSGDP